MENIDIVVFISYCIVILSIGLYVSRDKKGSSINGNKLQVLVSYHEILFIKW